MLLSLEEVEKLFQCPVTGLELLRDKDTYRSYEESDQRKYEIHNKKPILVDFDTSVISRPSELNASQIGESPITRIEKLGLRKLGSSLVSTDSSVTRNNINRLIELLIGKKPARVLVVGGGSIGKGIDRLYSEPGIEIVAFDIYASDNVQFVADAHSIPLKSEQFDAVIVQAVLEHVINPEQVVSEIWRVLKPDGFAYAETPFMQQVHEGAYDFTRFTESGHRNLFRYFETISSGVTSGPSVVLLWAIDYFFSGVLRTRKAGKIAKLIFFWLKYFDKVIPDAFAIDSPSGVYFMGERRNDAVSTSDIIKHYQGHQQ